MRGYWYFFFRVDETISIDKEFLDSAQNEDSRW
jgi:hypothetical protein